MHRRSAATTSIATALISAVLLSNNNSLAFVPRGSAIGRTGQSIDLPQRAKGPRQYASKIESGECEEFFDYVLNSHQDLQKERSNLKRQLLDAADAYKTKEMTGELLENTMAADGTKGKETERGYVTRLLSRIVKKIRRKQNPTTAPESKNILSKQKFRTTKLDTGKDGEAVIALANQLIELNPTPVPTLGFRGYEGGIPNESKLNGLWKLRFTTAADATFSESPKRGKSTTSQEIDTTKGTFTNIVDFERGKLEGFRVVVNGEPVSEDEVDLSFSKVVLLRKSRFPRLLGRLSFPLPSKLIRRLSSGKDARGPFLKFLYLDDDLRIHKSGTGNLFIQSRIH